MKYITFELIIKKLQDKQKLSKKEIVAELGYRNISKGLNTLHKHIRAEFFEEHFIEKILTKFPELKTDIEDLISSIKAKAAEDLIASFRPYIFVETERTRPSQIVLAALTGLKDKIIEITLENPSIEQISETIKEHYIRTGGEVSFFGKVLSYIYIPTLKTSKTFDRKGRLLNPEAGEFQKRISVSVNINGKKLSKGLIEKFGLSIKDESLN